MEPSYLNTALGDAEHHALVSLHAFSCLHICGFTAMRNGPMCAWGPFCRCTENTRQGGAACQPCACVCHYYNVILWIQDKGNYFCPAGPDSCAVWPLKNRSTDYRIHEAGRPEEGCGVGGTNTGIGVSCIQCESIPQGFELRANPLMSYSDWAGRTTVKHRAI